MTDAHEATGGDTPGAELVADGGDRRDDDINDVWQRLREDLGSLERRLEEVEER